MTKSEKREKTEAEQCARDSPCYEDGDTFFGGDIIVTNAREYERHKGDPVPFGHLSKGLGWNPHR